MTTEERLLHVVKLAYRKHVMNDENIGWTELDEALLNALCEALGDVGFQRWLIEIESSVSSPSAQ